MRTSVSRHVLNYYEIISSSNTKIPEMTSLEKRLIINVYYYKGMVIEVGLRILDSLISARGIRSLFANLFGG